MASLVISGPYSDRLFCRPPKALKGEPEMAEKDKIWLTTESPAIVFEDNTVGRLKKKIWDASEKEIDEILVKYEIPLSRNWENPAHTFRIPSK